MMVVEDQQSLPAGANIIALTLLIAIRSVLTVITMKFTLIFEHGMGQRTRN